MDDELFVGSKRHKSKLNERKRPTNTNATDIGSAGKNAVVSNRDGYSSLRVQLTDISHLLLESGTKLYKPYESPITIFKNRLESRRSFLSSETEKNMQELTEHGVETNELLNVAGKISNTRTSHGSEDVAFSETLCDDNEDANANVDSSYEPTKVVSDNEEPGISKFFDGTSSFVQAEKQNEDNYIAKHDNKTAELENICKSIDVETLPCEKDLSISDNKVCKDDLTVPEYLCITEISKTNKDLPINFTASPSELTLPFANESTGASEPAGHTFDNSKKDYTFSHHKRKRSSDASPTEVDSKRYRALNQIVALESEEIVGSSPPSIVNILEPAIEPSEISKNLECLRQRLTNEQRELLSPSGPDYCKSTLHAN